MYGMGCDDEWRMLGEKWCLKERRIVHSSMFQEDGSWRKGLLGRLLGVKRVEGGVGC